MDSSSPMPCAVCQKSIIEEPLRCTGPHCAKFFHPFCGDLNISSWKALTSDDCGLYWFCMECRAKLDEPNEKKEISVTLSNLADKIKEVESMTRKLLTVISDCGTLMDVPVENLLSEEVWVQIFSYLDYRQLLQVRETCRSWYQIVGGSQKLMDRLVLRFPANTVLDVTSDQHDVLSTTKSRFTHASLDIVQLIQVDSWWPILAVNLQVLSVSNCKLTLEMLLNMLRPMANLKCFKFMSHREFKVLDGTTIDFQLKSMEKFTLYDSYFSPVLDVFRQLFPCLKALKLHVEEFSYDYENKVNEMVKGIQSTVQYLKIYNSLTLWNNINQIGNLRLKGLSFLKSHEGNIKVVGKKQIIQISFTNPNIEHLDIRTVQGITNMELNAIGTNLPNLKKLKARVHKNSDKILTFLRRMPNLEVLDIKGSESSLSGYRNRKLHSVRIDGISFESPCIECFPNVRTLSLKNLYLPNWCAVFNPKFKNLKSVNLEGIKVLSEECLTNYLENLQDLTISNVLMGESFLNALMQLSPYLKHVNIDARDCSNENEIISFKVTRKSVK